MTHEPIPTAPQAPDPPVASLAYATFGAEERPPRRQPERPRRIAVMGVACLVIAGLGIGLVVLRVDRLQRAHRMSVAATIQPPPPPPAPPPSGPPPTPAGLIVPEGDTGEIVAAAGLTRAERAALVGALPPEVAGRFTIDQRFQFDMILAEAGRDLLGGSADVVAAARSVKSEVQFDGMPGASANDPPAARLGVLKLTFAGGRVVLENNRAAYEPLATGSRMVLEIKDGFCSSPGTDSWYSARVVDLAVTDVRRRGIPVTAEQVAALRLLVREPIPVDDRNGKAVLGVLHLLPGGTLQVPASRGEYRWIFPTGATLTVSSRDVRGRLDPVTGQPHADLASAQSSTAPPLAANSPAQRAPERLWGLLAAHYASLVWWLVLVVGASMLLLDVPAGRTILIAWAILTLVYLVISLVWGLQLVFDVAATGASRKMAELLPLLLGIAFVVSAAVPLAILSVLFNEKVREHLRSRHLRSGRSSRARNASMTLGVGLAAVAVAAWHGAAIVGLGGRNLHPLVSLAGALVMAIFGWFYLRRYLVVAGSPRAPAIVTVAAAVFATAAWPSQAARADTTPSTAAATTRPAAFEPTPEQLRRLRAAFTLRESDCVTALRSVLAEPGGFAWCLRAMRDEPNAQTGYLMRRYVGEWEIWENAGGPRYYADLPEAAEVRATAEWIARRLAAGVPRSDQTYMPLVIKKLGVGIPSDAFAASIVTALDAPEPTTRWPAVAVVWYAASRDLPVPPTVADAIARRVNDPDSLVRNVARRCVGKLGRHDLILPGLSATDEADRLGWIAVATEFPPADLKLLVDFVARIELVALDERKSRFTDGAKQSLAKLQPLLDQKVAATGQAGIAPSAEVMALQRAAWARSRRVVVSQLLVQLRSDDADVRFAALQASPGSYVGRPIGTLYRLMESDPDLRVRKAAAEQVFSVGTLAGPVMCTRYGSHRSYEAYISAVVDAWEQPPVASPFPRHPKPVANDALAAPASAPAELPITHIDPLELTEFWRWAASAGVVLTAVLAAVAVRVRRGDDSMSPVQLRNSV